MNQSPKEQIDTMLAHREEQVRYFDMIKPKGNWKEKIDAVISIEDLVNCSDACMYFTGTDLRVVEKRIINGKTKCRVKSVGYYGGPCN